jgi:hypothetical protein
MYDLHCLGWHDFQQLCLTITREILGQTVESFLDSSDAGKDGAFAGTWNPRQGEALHGCFVIQCKFTSKPGKNLALSDLTDEVEKVRRLVQNERCDNYILITNAGLSGSIAEDVSGLFKGAGAKQVVLFGSTWICDQIKENKRLRMLVPRLYGLGDLSQILDERAYSQAKALLTSLSEDLSKVVLTGAYRKAAEALNQHGFVLLIGEPAAGKTTIASMLSIGALDQWGASTLKLDDPEKVVERWNPDEPSQFFWVDDAFGVTQYESFLVNGWNHALPMINTMLRQRAKIVMTSRDYIYKRARNDLKEGAFPLLRESQVVIDVHDLTLEEKQQIHLPFIAAHSRFVPETARRLGDPIFTPRLGLNRYDLNDFVEKQELLLQEVIRGLDEHSKAALALIYMRNNSLESPIKLEESEREAIERLGSNLGGCITALESLNGSLVQYTAAEATDAWRFKHPTVGDAYAGLLLQSHELLGIYVHGSPIDKLTAQVTCGDVGIERAVALPRGLFPLVIKRLDEFSSTTRYKTPFLARWYSKGRIDDFLSSRCSKEFLLQYVEQHGDVFERVSKPGLFLDSVSEVDLALRLHEFGILPEKYRQEFVTTVVTYAIDGEDFYALKSLRIQSVFTSAELSAFRERVRSELLPNLADIRRTWQSNRNSDQAPDEHMQPLVDSFSALKQEFADEPAILAAINKEVQSIEQWVAEKIESEPKTDRPARTFGDVDTPDLLPVQARGVFDDVDQ